MTSPNNQDQQQGYQQPPQQQQQQPPMYTPPPTAYGAGNKPNMNEISAGFKRFSLGRQLVVGGGVVAFIAFFLPWVSFGIAGVSVNGIRGIAFFAFLLVIAVTVALGLPLFGKKVSDIGSIPLNDGQIALFGSGGALALSLLYMLDGFSYASFGFFLAMLAMAAMTYGGWLMFQAKE